MHIPIINCAEAARANSDNNYRGWTEFVTRPGKYLDPWLPTIIERKAVIFLNPTGRRNPGHMTHTKNCYGGDATPTAPASIGNGVHEDILNRIDTLIDAGVTTYLYVGGLWDEHSGPYESMRLAAEALATDSGLPDSPLIRLIFDNEGERYRNHTTTTDWLFRVITLAGRTYYTEPAPRLNPYMGERSCSSWDRELAARADKSDNRLMYANLVLVMGNQPADPKTPRLATVEQRVAMLKQLTTPRNHVGLTVSGMTPAQFKEMVP